MPVGLLTLELHIPDAQSLKDKRQVLRSLKDRLRRDFNVAVAELEHHDVWQRSVVGVVTISNEEKQDRKSTRLNSSHGYISYAVFCLKKKKNEQSNRTVCYSTTASDSRH